MAYLINNYFLCLKASHFFIVSLAFSQSIQINEVVSSNQSTYYDEDADTPDWIELFNPQQTFQLNWGLSDDVKLYKWRIPNVSLEPQDFYYNGF